jgi:uncharacterized protein YjbJ (UPF0337 family)
MPDASPAQEARKGLLSSVTGKAKEVAGALFGNDSLAAEGQLQQAEAATRKDASALDAVADAEAREAAEKLAREQDITARRLDAVEDSAEARLEATAREADVKEQIVEAKIDAEQTVAEREAEIEAQDELRRTAARASQQLAVAQQQEASARREREQEAARAEVAEQAAARARADADRIAAQADLPSS